MEGQKTTHGGTKLTRTNSSLLRSPTVRSSVHSLSALSEDNPDEEKPHRPHPTKQTSSPSLLHILLLSLPFLLLLFLLFHYLNDQETPLLSPLFLASAAVAIAVSVSVLRRWRLLRAGCRGFRRGESVQWFIGDDGEKGVSKNSKEKNGEKIVRGGVEFYSNGDFYEGEFHKGRCNGSGVYNFFVKGRFEGDWRWEV